MRAAKRLQTIHVKDEQGRIVSSWQRVRVAVPDGISASLPPPYTRASRGACPATASWTYSSAFRILGVRTHCVSDGIPQWLLRIGDLKFGLDEGDATFDARPVMPF